MFKYVRVSEKLLILLRDGRKLLGIFRSFDQFGNVLLMSFFLLKLKYAFVTLTLKCSVILLPRCLDAANAVLEGACERVIVGDLYCDIPLGLYVIRGENVVLIGELVRISKLIVSPLYYPKQIIIIIIIENFCFRL